MLIFEWNDNVHYVQRTDIGEGWELLLFLPGLSKPKLEIKVDDELLKFKVAGQTRTKAQ
ncbi:MAG: hypothetical protein H7Y86_04985 [Rhizobacter sp.]|nr:hypothetical protein [Ferruginibacter sp.]